MVSELQYDRTRPDNFTSGYYYVETNFPEHFYASQCLGQKSIICLEKMNHLVEESESYVVQKCSVSSEINRLFEGDGAVGWNPLGSTDSLVGTSQDFCCLRFVTLCLICLD